MVVEYLGRVDLDLIFSTINMSFAVASRKKVAMHDNGLPKF